MSIIYLFMYLSLGGCVLSLLLQFHRDSDAAALPVASLSPADQVDVILLATGGFLYLLAGLTSSAHYIYNPAQQPPTTTLYAVDTPSPRERPLLLSFFFFLRAWHGRF